MSLEFNEQFVPVRSPTSRFVIVDHEAVVLDNDGRIYRLNPTAAMLWECFDGSGSIGEIAQDVGDELEIPYADVLAEVLELARRLGASGLLDTVESPGTPAGRSDSEHAVDATLNDPRFLKEPPNT